MKNILAVIFAIWASAAAAQDIPNHSMPIGKGAGAIGLGSVGPCNPGEGASWNSSASDPVCITTSEFQLSSYCTVDFTGTVGHDMGPCINTTLIAASNSASPQNRARVRLPCGTLDIETTILRLAFVEIAGGGMGCTKLNINAAVDGIGADADKQEIFSSVHDLSIICVTACTTKNGWIEYSRQASTAYRIQVKGFTDSGGTARKIAPSNSSPTQYYTASPYGLNGNNIFNSYADWHIENVNVGTSITGVQSGGICIGGTAIDTTDNFFQRTFIWGADFGTVLNVCADTNHFDFDEYHMNTNGVCFTIGNNGVAGYATNDVWQQHIRALCSVRDGALNVTMLVNNGGTWGHDIELWTDSISPLNASNPLGACVISAAGTVQFSRIVLPQICDNTIPANATTGVLSGFIDGGQDRWFRASNTGTNVPAYSFYGDAATGVFHNAAGAIGLIGSSYLQLYVAGGTFNTALCSTLTTNLNGQVQCSDVVAKTYAFGGPLQITQTPSTTPALSINTVAASTGQGVLTTQSMPASGSATADPILNKLNITSDNYNIQGADVTNAHVASGLDIEYTLGGANLSGERDGIRINMNLNVASNNLGVGVDIVGIVPRTIATANYQTGSLTASNPQSYAIGPVTVDSIVGEEIDVSLLTSAGTPTVNSRIGLLINNNGGVTNASSPSDAAIAIAGAGGAGSFKSIISLGVGLHGAASGSSPLINGGSVITTNFSGTQTMGSGIVLSNVTFTNYIFQSDQFAVTGKGHLGFGTGSVPTANACAGFALGTGANDSAGKVSFTSATSCSITFGTNFTNAPFCSVTPGSAASTVEVVPAASGFTATFGTAQTAMQYHCFGT